MRQIPFVSPPVPRANGAFAWHWKPSPRLRKLGFANRHLGDTPTRRMTADIIAAATALNDQVAAMDAGAADIAAERPVPRKWRWCDLVDDYRASNAFRQEIAPATRKEYDLRLRQLTEWALDGQLALADIDGQMVATLKEELLRPDANGNPGSVHTASGMLRVLRMMLRRATAKGLMPADPTAAVVIPTPPSRVQKLDWEHWQAMASAARRRNGPDWHSAALAIEVAFWSIQRQADLLGLNRMAWRVLHGADSRDLPVMAGEDGKLRGFRLQQGKTGKWVDCPMPPWLHGAIAAAFEAGQWLLPDPQDPARPMNPKMLQRRVRALLDEAGHTGNQFRDLRRSGMSWMKDMGARESNIFTISGHGVLGKRTIVDTYMPPDTRSAIACIAAAERTRQKLAQEEQEQEQ